MKDQKTRKRKAREKVIKRFFKGSLKCSFTSSTLYFHKRLGLGKTIVAKRKGDIIVEKLY